MRAVFGLVLILGLGLAGGAVYMAQDYISAYQRELAEARKASQPPFKSTQIYVIEKPVAYGDILTPEHVRKVHYNADALPEGTFADEAELFPTNDPDPRIVLQPMEKNEPLLSTKVTAPGEDAGLTSRLETGMRAFAIKVDVASGVSGFLRPGDHVDIYWTGRVDMGGGENSEGRVMGAREVTKLIESSVKIIAVDQQAGAVVTGTTIARTVTVSASTQQVAALTWAQNNGSLTLSLVGAGDNTVSESIQVDQNAVLGLVAAPAPAPVQKEEVCTIRTRRGAEVIEIPIPCTN